MQTLPVELREAIFNYVTDFKEIWRWIVENPQMRPTVEAGVKQISSKLQEFDVPFLAGFKKLEELSSIRLLTQEAETSTPRDTLLKLIVKGRLRRLYVKMSRRTYESHRNSDETIFVMVEAIARALAETKEAFSFRFHIKELGDFQMWPDDLYIRGGEAFRMADDCSAWVKHLWIDGNPLDDKDWIVQEMEETWPLLEKITFLTKVPRYDQFQKWLQLTPCQTLRWFNRDPKNAWEEVQKELMGLNDSLEALQPVPEDKGCQILLPHDIESFSFQELARKCPGLVGIGILVRSEKVNFWKVIQELQSHWPLLHHVVIFALTRKCEAYLKEYLKKSKEGLTIEVWHLLEAYHPEILPLKQIQD